MSESLDAPSPASIRGGRVLNGKYRLERELGRGAMGTVWSAIHLTLDQRVAIKVISSEYANSVEAIQRFHTEAKAAAKLRSRYVVQVYDDGETPEGLPYIVMEYLEGESLEDRIARDGDLPLAEAVRIATHVGRALARAHGRGIVHRDLKPANIYLARTEDDDQGWIAKVLDFGIAKLDDNVEVSTTKTGTVLGTPLFMSAEQVRGASTVDARADLYSLGMVFYNMLTGKYAFEGSSFGDLLVSICTDPLPKLSQHAPWAPRALEQWFEKACARDVSLRYQSADEMIDELYAAANLSFDGRMSFSDEHSSVNHFVAVGRDYQSLKASDTGNEAMNSYATAETQNVSATLATNTGDASVHTISRVPESKRRVLRWLLPAMVGSAALVALGLIVWLNGSSDPAVATNGDRSGVAVAAEPAQVGAEVRAATPSKAQTSPAGTLASAPETVAPEVGAPPGADESVAQAEAESQAAERTAAEAAASSAKATKQASSKPKATAKPKPRGHATAKAGKLGSEPSSKVELRPKGSSSDVDIGF